MNDHTMHTDNDALAADVADVEESLYEFDLPLRDMIARHLWQGASREQRMTGLLIEGIDNDLVELYRRAAVIQKHLRAWLIKNQTALCTPAGARQGQFYPQGSGADMPPGCGQDEKDVAARLIDAACGGGIKTVRSAACAVTSLKPGCCVFKRRKLVSSPVRTLSGALTPVAPPPSVIPPPFACAAASSPLMNTPLFAGLSFSHGTGRNC
ncbi:hypothetical protein PUG42_27005 [Erwiniaceae bacterium L1_54_3]|nr:hypothetical protein [Erwiniaceae bacterium L1_54_3]